MAVGRVLDHAIADLTLEELEQMRRDVEALLAPTVGRLSDRGSRPPGRPSGRAAGDHPSAAADAFGSVRVTAVMTAPGRRPGVALPWFVLVTIGSVTLPRCCRWRCWESRADWRCKGSGRAARC